jgi:signal-transduction protein with cAMP-binding, CBS, and nucleotidyltransferase domain
MHSFSLVISEVSPLTSQISDLKLILSKNFSLNQTRLFQNLGKRKKEAIMNMIDLLSRVEVFKGLDQIQLNAVKDCCQMKTFVEGEKISGEGEEAAFLWAVIDGRVALRYDLPGRKSSEEMTIATISEGKVFGWSSFVPPYKYRLSCYCSSKDCQLIEIKREGLLKVFEAQTLIGYRVMTNVANVIGTRFQQLQEEVARHEGEIMLHQKDN